MPINKNENDFDYSNYNNDAEVNEAEDSIENVAENSKKKKKRKFSFPRLKKGRHFRFETFSITLGVMAGALAVTTICGYADWQKQIEQRKDWQTVYTSQFVFSQTGVTGAINNVYISEDKTKAVVLMQISDPSQLSTDANDYSVLVLGADGNPRYLRKEVKGTDVSAALYSFGDTGYFALYLVNPDGFTNQLIRVVIQNLKPLADNGYFVMYKNGNDKTFEKYDMCDIYINPGAESAVVIDALNTDGAPDPKELYQQTLAAGQETQIRRVLNQDIEAMEQTYNHIAEYAGRLKRDNLVIPDIPEIVAGDTFKIIRDENGKELYTSYTTETDFDNGVNFDWQDTSMESGYINKIISPDENAALWIMNKGSQKDTHDISTSNYVWKFEDGTYLEDLKNGANGLNEYDRISANIQNYISALNQYIALKQTYETDHLMQMLVLEESLSNADKALSINSDPEKMIVKYEGTFEADAAAKQQQN